MKLFRPAWDSENWRKAVKAAEKIKDETKLARIATEARCWQACVAAAERITDQSLLARIATEAWCRETCLIAVEKVTDPVLLMNITTEAWYLGARQAAVERSTDQNILADIARKDRDSDVRKAAVERLSDQSILIAIVKKDEDSAVRIAASRQLVNYDLEEDLLTYIVRMLGDELKNSGDEKTESREKIRRSAAEALLAWYRRYGESKQGEAIRQYEGKYTGGRSDDQSNNHRDTPANLFDDDGHTDYHTDTTYTIHFNPEEA
jgi:hypothetical protein